MIAEAGEGILGLVRGMCRIIRLFFFKGKAGWGD